MMGTSHPEIHFQLKSYQKNEHKYSFHWQPGRGAEDNKHEQGEC